MSLRPKEKKGMIGPEELAKINKALEIHKSRVDCEEALEFDDDEPTDLANDNRSPRLEPKEPSTVTSNTSDSVDNHPTCLTRASGTLAHAPTERAPVPAASAPTRPVSSASTVSTSAVSASVRRPPTLDSSSTVKPTTDDTSKSKENVN